MHDAHTKQSVAARSEGSSSGKIFSSGALQFYQAARMNGRMEKGENGVLPCAFRYCYPVSRPATGQALCFCPSFRAAQTHTGSGVNCMREAKG